METIFLKLITQGIHASGLILIVIIIRTCFRRLNGNIRCILWGFVAVSLVFPFSLRISLPLKIPNPLSSVFHSDNLSEPKNILYMLKNPECKLTANTVSIPNTFCENQFTDYLFPWIAPAAIMWVICCFFLLLYMLFSNIRLYKKLNVSLNVTDNYRICDQIADAFVFGLINPCIYLPSNLKEQHINYILAHERAHIDRRDYLWKPLGYLLLTIYCFHPLVWISFILFCRDIEFACDEKVIRNMNIDERIHYSYTLLYFSSHKKIFLSSTAGFGKNSIKERITFIMKYKKSSAPIKYFSILLCALLTLLCVTEFQAASDIEIPTIESELLSDDKLKLQQCAFGFENLAAGEMEFYPETLSLTETSELIWTVNYIQMGLLVEIILIDQNNSELVETIEGGSGTGSFTELPAGNYRIAIRCSEKNLQNKVQRSLTGTAAFEY